MHLIEDLCTKNMVERDFSEMFSPTYPLQHKKKKIKITNFGPAVVVDEMNFNRLVKKIKVFFQSVTVQKHECYCTSIFDMTLIKF